MSGKTYTEEEIEETLSRSEELIQYTENLLIAGKVMFDKLGIPRGIVRRILNHPETSESVKVVGQNQIRRWEDSLGMANNNESTKPVIRKRKRNLITL
ncbi:MAG: hypothetical protein P8X74_14885 [Reinekea sp.]|jgi:hypothetical protein